MFVSLPQALPHVFPLFSLPWTPMSPPAPRISRIAICHPDLGIGGAERLIVDAALELASRGHYVQIFTAHHDKNRCFDETKDGKLRVTVYGDFLPRHVFYRLHALCAYIRCIYVALCMILFWSSFDIIIADQVSAVIPVFKLVSSKVIFYCHFPDLLLAKHTSFIRRLYRNPIDWIEEKTTGMADCVLVNSKFTASTFASTFTTLHAKGIRPEVLYPAVNVGQFVVDMKPSTNEFVFLSINRFERKKNIALAISAFALLVVNEWDNTNRNASTGKKLKLVIAGGYDQRLKENQEYLLELQKMCEEKGIGDYVVFSPSCSTTERDAYLAACLCLIYTPTDEHFGIVPLEAMASGKPVIACNSGGPKESIIHNETGFLCEPTPQNFYAAMRILFNEPEKAVAMGKLAREHVEKRFSRDVFGENLNNLVLEVLSGNMHA